jgi:hypothetical protein
MLVLDLRGRLRARQVLAIDLLLLVALALRLSKRARGALATGRLLLAALALRSPGRGRQPLATALSLLVVLLSPRRRRLLTRRLARLVWRTGLL